MADAMHAEHELENLRDQAGEDRMKSEHAAVELAAKAELAEIDHGLAQDRLNAIIVGVLAGLERCAGKDREVRWQRL
jgi:hypothetical protein